LQTEVLFYKLICFPVEESAYIWMKATYLIHRTWISKSFREDSSSKLYKENKELLQKIFAWLNNWFKDRRLGVISPVLKCSHQWKSAGTYSVIMSKTVNGLKKQVSTEVKKSVGETEQ